MSIYEHVKGLVTTREAAEHYGLKVNRNGIRKRQPVLVRVGLLFFLHILSAVSIRWTGNIPV